ncbi:hypothetical protein HIM_00483 [Hirsutella minnesotensis 3608]|nr:hypothetical protein HIM_00483 [Hirsutella minnesotensis 3608]
MASEVTGEAGVAAVLDQAASCLERPTARDWVRRTVQQAKRRPKNAEVAAGEAGQECDGRRGWSGDAAERDLLAPRQERGAASGPKGAEDKDMKLEKGVGSARASADGGLDSNGQRRGAA